MPIYLPIAELALDLFLLLGLGFGVGLLSGMFGVGGGFIMTPMLILLGVKPIVAVGTGAAQVVASSVSGTMRHWQMGNVDTRMGALLIGGGLIGAVTGVRVQLWLKALGQLDVFISLVYVVMLGVIGSLMLIEGINAWRISTRADGRSRRLARHHTLVAGLPLRARFPRSKLYVSAIPPFVAGIVVGWLTAIMGVGGGFVTVPALIYVIGVPTRVAIGTSVFQIIFVSSFTTVLQAWQNFNVDLFLAAPIIVGGVIGAQQGTTLSERLKAEQLRLLLALLVLGVAIRMGVDLVVTPRETFTLDVSSAWHRAPASPASIARREPPGAIARVLSNG